MLNLTKTDMAQKVSLVLTKKAKELPTCNVNCFLDISGSFEDEWRDGLVAKVFSRLMTVASKFDDDGDVPLYLFNTSVTSRGPVSYQEMPEDTESIKRWVLQKAGNFSWGGTLFAPIFKALFGTEKVVKTGGFLGFGGKKSVVSVDSLVQQTNDPCVVYVVTDGDASDYTEARQLAQSCADKNTYVMFVNVSEMARCALKLSEEFSHVGHVYLGNLNKVSDEQLIDALMTDEFLAWYKKAKAK